MADLVAGDVTYTIQSESRAGVRPQRVNVVKIQFGDGTDTYPAGGVPLTASKLGLPEGVVEALALFDDDDGSGIVWKYDFATNKVRGYVQGVPHGTAGSVTLDDYPATAAVGVSTGVSISREASAGAATAYLGRMQELRGGTDAPPAQTLYAEVRGY
jgi:hypothetical protein